MAAFGLVKTGVFLLSPGSTRLISFRVEVRKAPAEGCGSGGSFPSWGLFCPLPLSCACFVCGCKVMRYPETNRNCLQKVLLVGVEENQHM